MKFLFCGMLCLVATCWSGGAHAQISKTEYPAQPDLTLVSPEDALPPTFRGKITYRGFYKGKVAASLFKIVPMAGDVVVVMEFNGPSVSGSVQYTNALSGEQGTPDPARFMGRRDGAICHLSWNNGDENVSYCGRSEYRLNENDSTPQGQRVGLSVRIPSAEVVDYVERDQSSALALQQGVSSRSSTGAARHSAPQRTSPLKTDANGNIIATTAAMGMTLQEMMDIFVHADSMSWHANQYEVGSMKNVKYLTTNKLNTSYVAYGEYTYSGLFGGGDGWVKVKVDNGNLTCMEFWDQAGNCRGAGQSLSNQAISHLAGAMMRDMSSGGRPGSTDQNAAAADDFIRRRDERQNRINSGNARPEDHP